VLGKQLQLGRGFREVNGQGQSPGSGQCSGVAEERGRTL
jgi:hypothetical protein